MDIGAQIKELREEKGIPLEMLALGICTAESLRNMELGKEAVSKLLMELIFQRLGKSTDKLELILSEEVYKEEELMEQYEECLEKGDIEKAEAVLEAWAGLSPKDSNVHCMFYCRSKAYAELRGKKNPAKAKEWMQKALDVTMPGWQEKPLEEYWVSTLELENLLAFAKAQLAIGTKAELEASEQLLLACQRFIDGRINDGEEHAKIYAKCACLLGELYLRQGKQERAEYFAERAFSELRVYGISCFMEPLLKILVQCAANNSKGKPPYQNYLAALQHIRAYAGEEWRFSDSIFKNCSQQTYYIDHELFREERIAQGYSQEQVIEGVYKNPESLSRAERGKVTMRDSKLIRLFHRLGIEKCRYNGFVVTDEYDVLELKQQVDILFSRNCFEEAEIKIKKLEKRLDLSVAENRRWIEGYRIMLGTFRTSASKEELLEQAEGLLQETYRWKTNGVYRSPMDREALLVNQIGILLRKLGRQKEAVQLLEEVTLAMRNSKVSTKKRYREYSLLRMNLAKWECSVPLARENLCFTLECGKLRSLPMDYMTVACAMIDDPANFLTCREMIKDSYYLWELVCDDVNKEITRDYYKKKFAEEL